MRYRKVIILVICAFLATVILTLGCRNSAEEYVVKGASFIMLEQWDEAIAAYNKAIEISPKDAVSYNNRGFAYNKLGEYSKADADIKKAKELGFK